MPVQQLFGHWFELDSSDIQVVKKADHFDGGQGRFRAFIAGLGAGPFDGLFNGVYGQYAEADRYVVLQRHLGQALDAFAGDIFKMRRAASNYGADGYNRVVFFSGGNALDDYGQLKRSRRFDQMNIRCAGTVANQRINGASLQLLDVPGDSTKGEVWH